MDKYKELFVSAWKKQMDVLDVALEAHPAVCSAAKSVGQRPAHFLVGVVVLVSMFLLYGVGQDAFSQLVGFLYPLYASYKALKSEEKEDDTQWLTYWVVFGLFSLVESFTDLLLQWIPLYFWVKIVFLFWCFLPQTRGALLLYHKVVEPVLSFYEEDIDAKLADVKSMGSSVGSELNKEFGDDVRNLKGKAAAAAVRNM